MILKLSLNRESYSIADHHFLLGHFRKDPKSPSILVNSQCFRRAAVPIAVAQLTDRPSYLRSGAERPEAPPARLEGVAKPPATPSAPALPRRLADRPTTDEIVAALVAAPRGIMGDIAASLRIPTHVLEALIHKEPIAGLLETSKQAARILEARNTASASVDAVETLRKIAIDETAPRAARIAAASQILAAGVAATEREAVAELRAELEAIKAGLAGPA